MLEDMTGKRIARDRQRRGQRGEKREARRGIEPQRVRAGTKEEEEDDEEEEKQGEERKKEKECGIRKQTRGES